VHLVQLHTGTRLIPEQIVLKEEQVVYRFWSFIPEQLPHSGKDFEAFRRILAISTS
jgi:hypothetical protein